MTQHFKWRTAVKRYPAVSMLAVASILGAGVASVGGPMMHSLMFGGLQYGEFWRLLTPIFLHFGLAHLAFNLLWLSILGSRIEQLSGSVHLLMVVIVSGVFSNMIQVGWGGSAMFGGMSGVVYALLGYIWIKGRFVPEPGL
jgi:GlpG protein